LLADVGVTELRGFRERRPHDVPVSAAGSAEGAGSADGTGSADMPRET
jgi:hypothetical protein